MENKDIDYLQKELLHIETMGRDVDKGDYFDLFPMNWYSNENYKLKTEILDEALEKQCSINDTSLYANIMQEGVVDLAARIKARQNIRNQN